MSKFSVDLQELDNKLSNKRYKKADVEHRIEKVAFDVVRFTDVEDGTNLWQIQSCDDGEYIVSMYEDDEKLISKSDWKVGLSKVSNDLTFFYKNYPVAKVSSASLGISEDIVKTASSWLPKKLSENSKLVKLLLKQASDEVKQEVLVKFPELLK